MESSAARLLRLLSLFASQPQWSASELSERLGVTTRTIRRDIADLRDLGYPIDSVAGRTGGYRMGLGGRLPPLMLTDDEAVAMAVGLRATATLGIADTDRAARSAMTKLEQVLPPEQRERALALHAAATVVHHDSDVAVEPLILLAVAHASLTNHHIRFVFRRGEPAEALRRVDPYGLVCVARRWYMVAWDHDRHDWRTFRADRMSSVEVTGHTFERRASPDSESMVLSGIAQYPYDVWAEVVLAMPFETATTEVPRSVALIEPHPDGTLLRIGGDDLDWIARYVVRLGCDFTVMHPPELRDELRRLGERLIARSQLNGRADR